MFGTSYCRIELHLPCSAFKLLTAAGLRPNADLAYTILRACFDNKRPDMAIGYARQATASSLFHSPPEFTAITF